MNEVGFRVCQRRNSSWILGMLLFGALMVVGFIGAFTNGTALLLAIMSLLLMLGNAFAFLRAKKGHLFLGHSSIRWTGLGDQIMPTHSIKRVVWGSPFGTHVSLKSSRGKLSIELDRFALEDRLRIVQELRDRFGVEQKNWPEFCHRHAVKWLDKIYKLPRDPTPNREPESDEFLKTRLRASLELLAIFGASSVAWLLLFGEAMRWQSFWSPDYVLYMGLVLLGAGPLILFGVVGLMMFFRFPKGGQIQERVFTTEKERREFMFVAKYGVPLVMGLIAWVYGGNFALVKLFGMSPELTEILSVLVLLGLWIGGTITYACATRKPVDDPEIQDSVARWRKHYSLRTMNFDDRTFNESHFLA